MTPELATAVVLVAVMVVVAIIVRRLAARRSPFSPDRSHIHHRMLDLGLSHRQTVLMIYGICIALGLLSLLLSGVNQLYAFIGVFIAFGLILFVPTRGSLRAEELEADAYENGGGASR